MPIECCLILPDAERAVFDRVEGEYHFNFLRRFQLGDDFICWIRISVLYKSPTARILINGRVSEIFILIELYLL